MDARIGLSLLSLLALAGGCEIEVAGQQGSNQSDGDETFFEPLTEWPALESRTFQLEYLTSRAAISLIDPYVYRDRPGAPGTISNPTGIQAISVRETPDNLDKIARMLEQFDVAATAPSYRLHFRVVTANGDEPDMRLAPVAEALRKVFRFEGYSLVGEGYVTVSAGRFDLDVSADGTTSTDQHDARVNGGHEVYHLKGQVHDDQLNLDVRGSAGGGIETTLGFRPGQTLVLGSMPSSDKTVFIVVNVAEAEEGEPT